MWPAAITFLGGQASFVTLYVSGATTVAWIHWGIAYLLTLAFFGFASNLSKKTPCSPPTSSAN